MPDRALRGQLAHHRGVGAEALAEAALEKDGWHILARRLRTAAGEVDLVAEKDGLLAIVEVKARPSLADARRRCWNVNRRGCSPPPRSSWRSIRTGEATVCGSI